MPNVIQSTWLTAVSGAWATPADWSGDVTPNDNNSNEYDVSLGAPGTSGTADFTVTTASRETVGSLGLTSANATLFISKNIFTVDSKVYSYSDASNAGTIDIAKGAQMVFGAAGSPSNYSSDLWNTGSLILAGHLVLDAPWFGLYGPTGAFALAGGAIVGSSSGAASTFDNIDQTIAGSGSIGTGTNLALTNAADGVIDSNAASALSINTGSNRIENAGVIETTGNGGLVLHSAMQLDGQLTAGGKGALKIVGALVSGGGEVNVLGASSLILHKGELNISGAISIAAGGLLATTAGDTTGVNSHNVLAGDALSAGEIDDDDAISIADDSTLNISGTIFGAGGVNLQSTGASTRLEVFGGGLTLDDTGVVLLSDSASNSIVSNGTGVQLSDKVTTIEGAGVIGDTWLRVDESAGALIDADDSVGLTILGDTAAVAAGTESSNYFAGIVETTGAGGLTLEGGTLANAGTIEARGAGALTLSDEQLDSGDGVVETVGSGSIVLAQNSGISNQSYLTISAGGSLTTTSGDVSDQILASTFVNGAINIVAGSTLIADGQWVGAGSINAEGTSAATLEIAAGQELQLTGKGTFNLQGAGGSILSAGAGTVLQNSGDTISGGGVIGDANMTVDNTGNGKIDATGSTGLMLDSTPYNSGSGASYIYNTGILQSDSAAGLTIEQAIYSPGKMIADAGAALIAKGAVFGSGTATINGSGSVQYDAENDNDVYFGTGGTGTLIFEDSAQFFGAIWGFAADEAIDLGDFAYNPGGTTISTTQGGFGTNNGSLVLTNGTSNSSPLYLEGNYTAANLASLGLSWQFSSDGHEIGTTGADGTLIKLVANG